MKNKENLKNYRKKFTKFLSGETEVEKINSWDMLRKEVLERALKDYLFFPFFVGYVERYLWSGYTKEQLMETCLDLARDLFLNELIRIFHVDSKNMEELRY